MAARRTLPELDKELGALTNHVEKHPDPIAFPLASMRVDFLPITCILPDPVQARRVLPEAIHFAFYENRYTPVQALRELILSAQVAARQNSRPFGSVIDLLADQSADDTEEANAPKYTPDELLVRDLVTLAMTIRNDGQVNPLTVVDITQGVTRLFRIETGERRFWASWLLFEFLTGYSGNQTVPCIIVKSDKASVFRQARENTARAGLSAIAMARQAALLLMTVHGVSKPDYAVTNDFYRQALDLDLRDKREYTDDILAAMGGIGRMHFSHYKALLRLSDEALELADRHTLDEYRLRFVLNVPHEDQAEMVKQIITLNLTGRQIKAICEQQEVVEQVETSEDLPKSAVRLAGAAKSSMDLSGQGLAHALFHQEKDWQLARARLQMLKRVVLEAEAYIDQQ